MTLEPAIGFLSENERLLATINASPNAIVTIDVNGTIIDWNHQAEILFGWRRNQLLGRRLERILFELHYAAVTVELEQYQSTGFSDIFHRHIEMMGRHKNGHLFPIECSIAPIELFGKKYFAAFLSDISDRKEEEKKLWRSERAQRIIAYFATSMFRSNTVEDIFWDITENCIAALEFEEAVVYSVDEERAMLVQKAAYGKNKAIGSILINPFEIPLGKGIVGSVARSQKAEIVSDVSRDPRYVVDDASRLSELAVPIVYEGKTLGVIDSEHSQKGFFTQYHLDILTQMAAIAANKIIRVRAEEQIRVLNESLERKVEERTQALNEKNEENERLLLNILPEHVAARLRNGEQFIADRYENVTVMFIDLVGFTELAQRLRPRKLLTLLDVMFSTLDRITDRYGVEKIKTIGDCYMAVAGIPTPRHDHVEVMALMALDILKTMEEFRSDSLRSELSVRIGMHTGSVVAGVIGKKKFAYDLWGDTVNTTSRMESHGEAGRIHVTEEVYKALNRRTASSRTTDSTQELVHKFTFEERGEIDVKGKGLMRTWFLTGCNLIS